MHACLSKHGVMSTVHVAQSSDALVQVSEWVAAVLSAWAVPRFCLYIVFDCLYLCGLLMDATDHTSETLQHHMHMQAGTATCTESAQVFSCSSGFCMLSSLLVVDVVCCAQTHHEVIASNKRSMQGRMHDE